MDIRRHTDPWHFSPSRPDNKMAENSLCSFLTNCYRKHREPNTIKWRCRFIWGGCKFRRAQGSLDQTSLRGTVAATTLRLLWHDVSHIVDLFQANSPTIHSLCNSTKLLRERHYEPQVLSFPHIYFSCLTQKQI